MECIIGLTGGDIKVNGKMGRETVQVKLSFRMEHKNMDIGGKIKDSS
jgi:hypothetical protein